MTATLTPPLLEARALGKTFSGGFLSRTEATVALRDFDVSFDAGNARIVAVAGQSGSGKTTASQIILGLSGPTSGEVFYHGKPLRRLARAGKREFRRDVQGVLQDPFAAFNPFYRVSHVFDVAARNFHIGESAVARQAAISDSLEFVGLDGARLLGRYPHELSGGERQRLMIARAFLLRPKLIVADEPVSMIDASLRASILEIIIRLKNEAGISFLYITHDLSTAYHIADELLVLLDGDTVERGPARQVIDSPSHRYTRELIDSVPVPDPEIRWRRPAATQAAAR